MSRLSLALTAAIGLAATPARASVTYALAASSCHSSFTGGAVGCLAFRFTVSDAAVARGSFDLVEGGVFGSPQFLSQHSGVPADAFHSLVLPPAIIPFSYYGDLDDFFGFTGGQTTGALDGPFPRMVSGALFLHAKFAADRSLQSGSFESFGVDTYFRLDGSGSDYSGVFGTDGLWCGNNACTIQGQMTSDIPEPGSARILLAALTGLLAALWGRRA